jgi:hypothetical protein
MNESINLIYNDIDRLYADFIPLAGRLVDTGRAIGFFGAVLFISAKVWKHLANNEPINFYPLLRPFGLGLLIGLYIPFINVLNGILDPIYEATRGLAMIQSNQLALLVQQRDQLVESTRAITIGDVAMTAAGFPTDTVLTRVGLMVTDGIRWFFSIFSMGGELAIKVISTFILIVLTLVGPISLGVSIFPGFEGTLLNWLGRYINVFFWTPVAYLYGAIIERLHILMVQNEINNLVARTNAAPGDMGYIIFEVIAALGYFMVPTVAGWIISTSGMAGALGTFNQAGSTVSAGAGAMVGGVIGYVGSRVAGGSSEGAAKNPSAPGPKPAIS